MSAADAQAVAAWTSASATYKNVPAAAVAAWLLEQGAPVDLLLPESEGPASIDLEQQQED